MRLRIGTGLLSTKPQARRGASGSERTPQGTDISFSVTGDYPSRVEEASDSMHRAVGRSGNTSLYSILALNMGRGDVGIAREVKARAIEHLLGYQDECYSNSFETIRRAYDTCLSIFSQYTTSERKETLAYLVAHDIVGYGPFSILLEDSANIEEIEINAPTQNITVFHSRYGRCITNLRFNSEGDFRFMLNRLISATEKELNSTTPVIDAQLPDGSRVHAQLRPFAISGAAATIRLSGSKSIDIRHLMESGTLSPEVLAYLWLAVETNQNIIVSGAPASGKTSLLLAINAFAPPYQRVVTIEEDINELKFYGNFRNVVPLQASSKRKSVSLTRQVVNSLHMRPERLIVGEIRGDEAGEVFSAANLGVPFMTTMHSSSNGTALVNRLLSKPMSVQPSALNMLDVSLFMVRKSESDRALDSIVEYWWHSRNEIPEERIQELSGRDYAPVELYRNGRFDSEKLRESKVIAAYRKANHASGGAAIKEFRKREKFLDAMMLPENEKKVHDYIWSYWDIK